ncbi:hypothetical protein PoB_002450100 [Plakobranchus ocellatus]|uniref:Uncharacterized protein n=1 Tax=Plakobranchus ocellatus TaxID=259542 RepID=A0AAV3ZPY6_9GAST|nr:hypothetical protein PoB_002450100 [Plakobranchus ocellatus]
MFSRACDLDTGDSSIGMKAACAYTAARNFACICADASTSLLPVVTWNCAAIVKTTVAITAAKNRLQPFEQARLGTDVPFAITNAGLQQRIAYQCLKFIKKHKL